MVIHIAYDSSYMLCVSVRLRYIVRGLVVQCSTCANQLDDDRIYIAVFVFPLASCLFLCGSRAVSLWPSGGSEHVAAAPAAAAAAVTEAAHAAVDAAAAAATAGGDTPKTK